MTYPQGTNGHAGFPVSDVGTRQPPPGGPPALDLTPYPEPRNAFRVLYDMLREQYPNLPADEQRKAADAASWLLDMTKRTEAVSEAWTQDPLFAAFLSKCASDGETRRRARAVIEQIDAAIAWHVEQHNRAAAPPAK
jgi:hypothetical protein